MALTNAEKQAAHRNRQVSWKDIFTAAHGNVEHLDNLYRIARRFTYDAHQREQNCEISEIPLMQKATAAAAKFEDAVNKALCEAIDRVADDVENRKYQEMKELLQGRDIPGN